MHNAPKNAPPIRSLSLLALGCLTLAGCLGSGTGDIPSSIEIKTSGQSASDSSTTPFTVTSVRPATPFSTTTTNLAITPAVGTSTSTGSTSTNPFTVDARNLATLSGTSASNFSITPTLTSTSSSNNSTLSAQFYAALNTFFTNANLYGFLANYLNPPCQSSFGTFGPGNWPGACWRPFNSSSPFNRPIPANPTIASNSAQIVAWLNSGTGTPNDLQVIDDSVAPQLDYGHPTYYSSPTDPVFTVQYSYSWGASTTLPAGSTLRIPDAAKPAGGEDGHMTVVDQANGMVYSFWSVTSKPAGGGILQVGGGGAASINGTGISPNLQDTVGTTSAGYSNLAGIIRAQELIDGQINHALFVNISCSASTFVYPAVEVAYQCSGNPGIPNGTHFYLDYTLDEINALAVPNWKKTILRAMATYGMYVGDTSGPGGATWALEVESGQTYLSLGYPQPLVTFAQLNNIPFANGQQYRFPLQAGVDWTRLKVLDPCVAQGTCSN